MLQPGAALQNRYLILKQIGQGGMGAVYRAKDQRLNTTVALKETFFQDDVLLRAFQREAHLLAGLKHPALPKVSDHFTEGAGQYLVMEYIEGDDLESMLKRRGAPFAVGQVLGWAEQLLDALDYLHSRQPPIIHRDIKPQNLKLTDRGQIILLDFGLAKGAIGETFRPASDVSVFGYTPTYAPLEQVQRAGTDARSDLYSLAATLYVLLTGVTPPDALTRAGAVLNVRPDPLLPADQVNPQVPPGVAAVLTRAMSLKRDQRPANAAEMRLALRNATKFGDVTTGSLQAVTPQTAATNSSTTPGAAARATVPPAQVTPYTVPPSPPQAAPPQPSEPRPIRPTAPLPGKSNRLMAAGGGLLLLLVVSIAFALMYRGNSAAPNAASDTLASPAAAPASANANSPKEDKTGRESEQGQAPAANSKTSIEEKASAENSNISRAQDASAVTPPARKPTVRKPAIRPRPAPRPPRTKRPPIKRPDYY
ncbi:MAG TPA: serine/threonine-protein kinase [Blastocatellia bacterium]|nr:serine/threonine-protein kinase [Blastocatellia bacterium]